MSKLPLGSRRRDNLEEFEMVTGIFPKSQRGFSLTELMIVIALLGVMMGIGPALILNMMKFWWVQTARAEVQRDARASLDIINRNIRQATSSTVQITSRPSQPPYSWIQFSITKGTGPALGNYAYYQEGKDLKFMKNGSTGTLATNLRYVAFTYPRTDDQGIISVSLTFEKSTYSGYTKALQLSIEKVRIMN